MMRSLPALLVLALAAGLRAEIDRTLSAVVTVSGQFEESATFGAGIIFARERDRLYILTAGHVVRHGAVDARSLRVRFKSDPAELTPVLEPAGDPALDLAVLRVDGVSKAGMDGCAVPMGLLGKGELPKRSTSVFPVGNPNGVGWVLPVSPDLVADATSQEIRFQSATLAPGHSGGALLDENGLLLGVIRADAPPYGVAIPLATALEAVRKWGFRVDLYEADIGTPLHNAALRGDAAGVERLLKGPCAAVDARLDRDRTALHYAAMNGHADVERILLAAGADVNARDGWGRTPLAYAVRGKTAAAVTTLLDHGAHLRAHIGGQTLLAAVAGTPMGEELIPRLLDAGIPVNEGGEVHATPLQNAAAAGAIGQAKLLLAAGAAAGTRELKAAHGRDMLVLLLQAAPAVDTKEVSIWSRAGEQRWLDVLELLTKKHTGTLVDEREYTDTLGRAMKICDIEQTRILLNGVDLKRLPPYMRPIPDLLDSSDFWKLDTPGKLAMLDLLVRKGAEVRIVNRGQSGPICQAALNSSAGAPDVLRFLLAHGAGRDEYCGRDLLVHEAAGAGRLGALKVLLATGLSVNSKSPVQSEGTLLDHAVEYPEMVKFLLAAGASPNLVDLDGDTALHYAARAGSAESIRLLVRAGANPNVRNRQDNTPLLEARDPRIAALLKSLGAR